MNTILFVWMSLAANNFRTDMGWQNIGILYSASGCHLAAKNLGINPDKYRCIEQATGELKRLKNKY